MAEFLQLLFNGLTVGAVYALMALGYSLVWRTARTVNLAHGEFYTAGAYLTFGVATLAVARHVGSVAVVVVLGALLAAAAIGALFGAGIDLGVFRPLRRAKELAPLLCSLGVSAALQNVYELIYGTAYSSVPATLPGTGINLGGARLSFVQLTVLVTTALVVVALNLLLRRTRLGKAIRAVAADAPVARLMGIPADRIITGVFALASIFGAAGGVMVGLYYGVASAFMGFLPAVKGLAAAVLGGFGSISGAVVGGLLLGVLESLGAGYISTDWKDVFAYAVLILVIVVLPRGLIADA